MHPTLYSMRTRSPHAFLTLSSTFARLLGRIEIHTYVFIKLGTPIRCTPITSSIPRISSNSVRWSITISGRQIFRYLREIWRRADGCNTHAIRVRYRNRSNRVVIFYRTLVVTITKNKIVSNFVIKTRLVEYERTSGYIRAVAYRRFLSNAIANCNERFRSFLPLIDTLDV